MIEEKINFAIQLFQEGKYSEAKGFLKSIISDYKPDPRPYNILAIIEEKTGNSDEAIKILKKNINQFPEDEKSYYNLAKLHFNQGNTKESIEKLNQALKLNNNFIQPYISLGEIYYKEKNYDNTILNLQKALKIDPNYLAVNYSLANTYLNKGDIKNALKFFNKELKINPNDHNSLYGLGEIERLNNNVEAAIVFYKKSIQIKDTKLAYLQISKVLQANASYDEAKEYLERALKIYPNDYLLNLNLSNILASMGQEEEAFLKSLKALDIFSLEYKKNYELDDENYRNIFNNLEINTALKLESVSQINNLKNQRSDKIIKQSKIFIQNIIKNDNFDMTYLKSTAQSQIIEKLNSLKISKEMKNINLDIFINVLKDEFFSFFIKKESIDVVDIENFLIKARKRLLEALFSDIEKNFNKIDVIECLGIIALQCHNNEYIWEIDEKEIEIRELLVDTLENKKEMDSDEIENCLLGLSTLNSLYNYMHLISSSSNFRNLALKEIYNKQISEIILEQEIQKDIKELNPIKNKISSKVRNQYEENPYPRWQNISSSREDSYKSYIEQNIYPNKLENIDLGKDSKILIAGCGTGSHPIEVALKSQYSEVTALDLSKASLSYGIRKAKELGVNNINWIQGDILEVNNIKDEFDCIESIGVLHHMENPYTGFSTLKNKLKDKGIMKIGLYSLHWKSQFSDIKKYIKDNNFNSSLEDIRKIRHFIKISSNPTNIKLKNSMRDFYMTSAFRDLLLHEQEIFFTIPEIRNWISREFNFLGFIETPYFLNKKVKANYLKEYPSDINLSNLNNWNEYEINNPDIFQNMYQFWIQKIDTRN
tara:strand:+ start:3347 stop:5821 length:2475 start_codon:yes stop_codon:yes gene_type:complete